MNKHTEAARQLGRDDYARGIISGTLEIVRAVENIAGPLDGHDVTVLDLETSYDYAQIEMRLES